VFAKHGLAAVGAFPSNGEISRPFAFGLYARQQLWLLDFAI
jgi:hypothetical protein